MAINTELEGRSGCLPTLKSTIKNYLPGPYRLARDLRDWGLEITDPHKPERLLSISIGGIPYDMFIDDTQQLWTVQTPEKMLEEMLDYIQPGDIIYDVGAAIGTHTLPSAIKAGDFGRVYSFEPDDHRRWLLKRNTRLNCLEKNVTVLCVALWDTDTTLTIHTSGRGGKAPQATEIGVSANERFRHHLQIQARSIVSLVNDGAIKPPDVIKIDVEGGGMHVLRGMGDLRPREIFIEVHPNFGEDIQEIVTFLEKKGYQLPSIRERFSEIHLHFRLPQIIN